MLRQHVVKPILSRLDQIPVPFRALLLLIDTPGEMVAGDEVEATAAVPFRVVIDDLIGGRDEGCVNEVDYSGDGGGECFCRQNFLGSISGFGCAQRKIRIGGLQCRE